LDPLRYRMHLIIREGPIPRQPKLLGNRTIAGHRPAIDARVAVDLPVTLPPIGEGPLLRQSWFNSR
jgi:hypothetical protein